MCCHYTILHRRVLLYNAFHEIANAFFGNNEKINLSEKYELFLIDNSGK